MATYQNSDLNESNLNFLNEEASRFKEDEDLDEQDYHDDEVQDIDHYESSRHKQINNYSVHEEKKSDREINFPEHEINQKFQIENKKNQNSDKKSKNQISSNLQTKLVESLSKELIEKKHKIEFLQEQNSDKDHLIESLKKTIRSQQDKFSKSSKNLHQRQFSEVESELKLLGVEYMKLQETVNNKDKIINEFSKLSENTKNKFKMFEDANRILQEENEILNRTIDEYKNSIFPRLVQSENLKENQIKEMKEILSDYEKKSEKEKSELVKKEESLRSKYEEKENQARQKFKEREDSLKNEYFKEIVQLNSNLENSKTENEKMKSELKSSKHKMEEKENELQIKEIEYRKNLDKVEKDAEKLKRTIKEIENEFHAKEDKSDEKIENLQKANLEKEKFLSNTLLQKEKKIHQLEEEQNKNRIQIVNFQSQLKEEEFKTQNLEDITKQLKNQISEILNELNLQKNNFAQIEENKEKEVYQILLKLNEIVEEKSELEELNEELKKNLKIAGDKIRELNELILDKYQGIELNFFKEKSHKEYLERKYREAFKSMKSEEEKLKDELSKVKNLFEKKKEENEKLKIKYENKIQNMRLKLDDETFCKENLQDELESIKTNFVGTVTGMNPNSSKPYFYEEPPVRQEKQNHYLNRQFILGNVDAKLKAFRNADDVLQLQTLDNFKDLINKMDEKMGETGLNFKYDTNNMDYMENKHNDSGAVNISLSIPNDRFGGDFNKNNDGEFMEGALDLDGNYHIESEIERHIAEIKSAYRF